MEQAQRTELEELQAMVASDGWRIFKDTIAKLWGTTEGGGARFMEAVTQASRGGDAEALAQLRQVIVAQREIQAAMNYPHARIDALKKAQQQQRSEHPLPFLGRRGGL